MHQQPAIGHKENDKMGLTTDKDYQAFSTLLHEASKVVFFTGAGISTESGIPDFRSPNGLWTRMKPIQFQDFVSSAAVRKESWLRKFENQAIVQAAEPNQAHLGIRQLAARGKVLAVLTQNVDNLHQDSGLAEELIIELHGNSTYATCLDCGRRYELDLLQAQFEQHDEVLPCQICHGTIKTATVSFGQGMPVFAMRCAEKATLACDLFVVLGSSLSVYPAASFPELAKRKGTPLVIVNREPTPQDASADVVIHHSVGKVMAAIAGLNEPPTE